MPITMPTDTLTLLGADAAGCESRSLFMNRFAYPDAKDSGNNHPRRDWFNKLAGKSAMSVASGSRSDWLAQMIATGQGQILFTQLQSRLMVNMAGGVMENAGLCLDRFGLPFIPGSAVKGCARRAAIGAFHDWCETGVKPVGDDNLFTAACASFESPAEMLADVAHAFGWSEQEWSEEKKDDRLVSDFAWAGGSKHKVIWKATAEQIANQLHVAIRDKHQETPWKSLPNFAGSISFLPAYPVDLGKPGKVDGLPGEIPLLGKLELDIVTSHHGDYYASKDPDKRATDTEEPVPVVFPTVAAGHVFVFALVPLRGPDAALVNRVCTWLACGLSTFGLGAKTNAGYGWFEDVTDTIRALESAKKEQQVERARQAQEKAAIENVRASLQPDPELIEKLRRMKESDLRGQINLYASEERFWMQKDERVQLTLLYFLGVTATDSLAADRANPKSKIAKAIANLAAKFPHVASQKP